MAKNVILYKVGTANAIPRKGKNGTERVQQYTKSDILVIGTEDGTPKQVITNDELFDMYVAGQFADQVTPVANPKAKEAGYLKLNKIGGGQLPAIKAQELFEKFPELQKKGVSPAAQAFLTKSKRTRAAGTGAKKAPKTDPQALIEKMKAIKAAKAGKA